MIAPFLCSCIGLACLCAGFYIFNNTMKNTPRFSANALGFRALASGCLLAMGAFALGLSIIFAMTPWGEAG